MAVTGVKTEDRPSPGEIYLHCLHVTKKHFFKATKPIAFFDGDKQDNEGVGYTKWLVCCDECYNAHGDHFHLYVQIKEDTW